MNFLKPLAVALLCLVLPSLSLAQVYPSRPIQFIVPYTPGTTADTLARLLGTRISLRWNIPIVVDNRAGASGIIGAAAVAKAEPDGYTFLFAATSFSTLAATNPKLPYDSVKSFAPVSLLGTSSMTLVINNKFPANNVREFIDQVKKQPGVVNYASPGAGGSQHLAMELFKQEAGIDMVHIPYKGSAGAINDIIAGHVQASVVSLQSAAPFVQNGNIRMLAVMSSERVPSFPQVPTLAELGYGNMLVSTWYGMMAPAGTPPALVAKMNAEIDSLLNLPEVKEAMARQGVDAVGGKPEKFESLLRRELALWSQVVARGKIVIQ